MGRFSKESGCVTAVTPEGVADGLGVQAGWTISFLDGYAFSKALMDEKTSGSARYCITFSKPETEVEQAQSISSPVAEKPQSSRPAASAGSSDVDKRLAFAEIWQEGEETTEGDWMDGGLKFQADTKALTRFGFVTGELVQSVQDSRKMGRVIGFTDTEVRVNVFVDD